MKIKLSHLFLILTASVIQLFSISCAHKLSFQSESLPGNVKVIQIPLFKNNSAELGIESFFTNSLKTEALKSKFLSLKNEAADSEAILQGKITGVDVIADESVIEAKNTLYLPTETVIATQYKITVYAELTLVRKLNSEILWSGTFTQSSNYSAPQITLPVISSASALYNQSAKRQTLEALSKEMMQAAFDRMLENF